MNLVGVLDLMDGVVVRAVGGHRDEYRPVQSRICDSCEPMEVAAAFRREYGIEQLYVADLDAIRGGPVNTSPIVNLAAEGFRITLDAGFRSLADLEPMEELGITTFVAALETLPNVATLGAFIDRLGAERLRFSIDLVAGIPLADPTGWGQAQWDETSPLVLAELAAEEGVEQLIVLDLKAVGTAIGPTTAEICRQIKTRLPKASLWSGGGIRTAADALELRSAGADGVLIASALHDRTL